MQVKCLWKALLFSFLICLAGSIVWGIVYSFGFMVYLVALLTVVFAGQVFVKFYKFNILSFIWISVFAFLLNLVASILALNLEIVNDIYPEYSFARGLELLFDLIKTNTEIRNAFISDILFNFFAVIVGVSIVWINIAIRNKRAKNSTQIQTKANVPTTTKQNINNNQSNFDKFYDKLILEFNNVINEFKTNKDSELFKKKILVKKKNIYQV